MPIMAIVMVQLATYSSVMVELTNWWDGMDILSHTVEGQ